MKFYYQVDMAGLEGRVDSQGESAPMGEIKADSNPPYRLKFLGGIPRGQNKSSLIETAKSLYYSARRFGTEVYNRFF